MNYSLNNLLKQKSFFISITFSFVIIMFVYFNFFKFDKLNNFYNIFILSLVFSFVLISFLTFFIVNRISFFYQNYKLKKTGQELQKKILLIFATIVMTPTLLIAFFSIFIFDFFYSFIVYFIINANKRFSK